MKTLKWYAAILILIVAGLYAQTGKTIKAAKGDMIVVDEFPIKIIAQGDTFTVSLDSKTITTKKLTVTSSDEKQITVMVSGDADDDFTWHGKEMEDETISHDGKKMHVHVKKIDEGDGEHQIIIRKMGDEGEESGEKIEKNVYIMRKQGEGKKMLAFDGEDINLRPALGLGVLLKEQDGGIMVYRVPDKDGKSQLKRDDQITAISAKQVSTLKAFFSVYDEIKTGSKVPLKIKRDGKSMDLTVTKEAEKGEFIFIENK